MNHIYHYSSNQHQKDSNQHQKDLNKHKKDSNQHQKDIKIDLVLKNFLNGDVQILTLTYNDHKLYIGLLINRIFKDNILNLREEKTVSNEQIKTKLYLVVYNLNSDIVENTILIGKFDRYIEIGVGKIIPDLQLRFNNNRLFGSLTTIYGLVLNNGLKIDLSPPLTPGDGMARLLLTFDSYYKINNYYVFRTALSSNPLPLNFDIKGNRVYFTSTYLRFLTGSSSEPNSLILFTNDVEKLNGYNSMYYGYWNFKSNNINLKLIGRGISQKGIILSGQIIYLPNDSIIMTGSYRFDINIGDVFASDILNETLSSQNFNMYLINLDPDLKFNKLKIVRSIDTDFRSTLANYNIILDPTKNDLFLTGPIIGSYKFDDIKVSTSNQYFHYLAKLNDRFMFESVKLINPGYPIRHANNINMIYLNYIEGKILMGSHYWLEVNFNPRSSDSILEGDGGSDLYIALYNNSYTISEKHSNRQNNQEKATKVKLLDYKSIFNNQPLRFNILSTSSNDKAYYITTTTFNEINRSLNMYSIALN